MKQKNSAFREIANHWNNSTLIILDIDSTIVLTHKRNEAILHQFARELEPTFPEFCARLTKIECRPCEYGYGSALGREGLTAEDNGDSGGNKNALEALANYWRNQFFSNRFLDRDLVHCGAKEFVNFLNDRAIPHVYLTGRPRPTMFEGTVTTLNALGFPVSAENLFMKPEAVMVDEKFKTEKIRELKKRALKLVLIDNEPKILNQVMMDHPDAQMIFVDTCHSPNVKAPPQVPVIKDFSDFF